MSAYIDFGVAECMCMFQHVRELSERTLLRLCVSLMTCYSSLHNYNNQMHGTADARFE